MRFEYRCSVCGQVGDLVHPFGVAVFVTCTTCGGLARRHFSPEGTFYHQEDRRHMRHGRSHATGQEFAQSRREERAIEKEKGIEFVGKSDMPEQWKTLRDHYVYTKQGGEPLAPNVLNPPPDPKVEPGTILKIMEKKNLRFGAR